MRRTALCALALVLGSCGTEDLTQLMVVVDTDLNVPDEISEIVITVLDPAGNALRSQGPVVEESLPLRLAVVHRGGPLGPLQITVEARGPTQLGTIGTFLQRNATVWFVRGEVREVRMDLLRACVGFSASCNPATETCGAEGCRPRLLTEDELPVYEGPTRTDAGPRRDMGPADMDPDACVPVDEVCNGSDDDCDGRTDETFDLQSDMRNCGECGNACQADAPMGSTSCEVGRCVLTCSEGFADCDGSDPADPESNGCEADLESAATCGACGESCSGATPICDLGECTDACPDGAVLCSGDTCADLMTSVRNCGDCENACADAPNASPFCAAAVCGIRCDPGFSDCDGTTANGCESTLRELANCGSCGDACAGPNAMMTCATGMCDVVGCEPGFGDCDGEPMTGCEADLKTSVATCGRCDLACPLDPPNGAAICDLGACGVTCDDGYADCDGMVANGCEVYLGSTTSCGGCGVVCSDAAPVCEGSATTGFACVPDCGAGQTVCDGSCVDPATDVRHCGGCNRPCADPPGASPTCASGLCAFTCDAGRADCDPTTPGCEADLGTTATCGACDVSCEPAPAAMVGCSSSGCAITACSGLYRNCDGEYANGCEVDIATDPANCGACGRACSAGPNVASAGCAGSACIIDRCGLGFDDCDGDFANGCETSVTDDRKNCGGCGIRCTGPQNRCCDGSCC